MSVDVRPIYQWFIRTCRPRRPLYIAEVCIYCIALGLFYLEACTTKRNSDHIFATRERRPDVVPPMPYCVFDTLPSNLSMSYMYQLFLSIYRWCTLRYLKSIFTKLGFLYLQMHFFANYTMMLTSKNVKYRLCLFF